MKIYKCSFCDVVKFQLTKFLTHLQVQHNHQADFSVTCDIEGCFRRYKTVASYRNHIYRKHRQALQHPLFEKATVVEDDNESEEELPEDELLENNQNYLPGIDLETVLLGLRQHVALFILNLQEKHLLPKATQDTIVSSLEFILKFFQQNYFEIIKFHLTKSGFRLEDQEDLDNLLNNQTLIESVFAYVQSDYQLFKYCKEHLHLVEPVKHILGTNSQGKEDTFQYVPIIDVLKTQLEKHDIFESYRRTCEQAPSTDFLSSYTDGELFHESPFFGDPNIVRLHLYTDEYEVVNPLGSKRSVHKLAAFYFMIGNLESNCKSQLRHIHLCLLVRNQFIKKYSYRDILLPLINDLKLLYTEGLQVSVNGQNINLICALATISADNLSAHSLAGFTCCFSSGRICRFCMISYKDLRSHVNEDDVIIRSSQVHQYHLQALRESTGISKQTYGVVSECPFTELNYFDVTKNFPPDLMHDFLEGVVPLVITRVIQALHFLHIVSLSQINAELDAFKIGRNERANLPQKLPQSVLKKNTLSGSAAQVWCLFRILPFLIGHYIPEGEVHWDIYLKCRDIGDVILSPTIQRKSIPFLSLQIGEFLSSFQSVFPETFTPKLHFLIHYPQLILKFGPLKQLWCMRFEGKHQYFKRLAHNTCNFKNLSYTLAKRHQLRQCWELTSLDSLRQDNYTEGERVVPFRALPLEIQKGVIGKSEAEDVQGDERLGVCSSLKTNNVKYCVGDNLIIDLVEEDIPIFMKIVKILQFRGAWMIFGKLRIPITFERHYHAFKLEDQKEWILVQPGEEKEFHPLDTYVHDDTKYITLYHRVQSSR